MQARYAIYPKIKALAQREKAEIFFGDAAHMRSDHHAGRTWGKRGEIPIVETTGARHRMSLISAITARGHMRFMIKDKGGPRIYAPTAKRPRKNPVLLSKTIAQICRLKVHLLMGLNSWAHT